jgi:hypothetical protein
MVSEPKIQSQDMASSSTIVGALYTNAINERLTKANHVTWKAQVLAVLRGAHLDGHVTDAITELSQEVDGKEKEKTVKLPNPAYQEWYAADQQVLGFLFSSLSKEILPPVATKQTTSNAWKEIESMFSSQTRARTVNTRLQLATTQKGSMSVAGYVNKMRSLRDEMTAAGRTLEDEELVEYILTNIGPEYDPIISAVIARQTPVSVSEVYSQLLAFETRLALMAAQEGGGSSANSAYRSRGRGNRGIFCRGSGSRDGYAGGGRGGFNRGGGRGGSGRGGHSASNDKRPQCQVCKKKGHTADRCWHRFDEDYVSEE